MLKTALLIVIAVLLGYAFMTSTMLVANQREIGQLRTTGATSKTAVDAMMFCQELSSKATNTDWGYASCIKEMSKVISKQAIKTL